MEGEKWMEIRNDRLKGMNYTELSKKYHIDPKVNDFVLGRFPWLRPAVVVKLLAAIGAPQQASKRVRIFKLDMQVWGKTVPLGLFFE